MPSTLKPFSLVWVFSVPLGALLLTGEQSGLRLRELERMGALNLLRLRVGGD